MNVRSLNGLPKAKGHFIEPMYARPVSELPDGNEWLYEVKFEWLSARVKYRINRDQEFVIGGYTPDNPFDALIVGYYDEGKLYYVAKVRNGFVPRIRQEVYQRFKGLETDSCSFTNLPEKNARNWH
jgi:ATP-dependent DNA ligase